MSDCCTGKKFRSPEEKKRLTNRLARIEGQIRGIRAMIEEDAYCPDVLTQVSAASSALSSFSRELLESHIRTCVTIDVQKGSAEKTEELLNLLQKMMR